MGESARSSVAGFFGPSIAPVRAQALSTCRIEQSPECPASTAGLAEYTSVWAWAMGVQLIVATYIAPATTRNACNEICLMSRAVYYRLG